MEFDIIWSAFSERQLDEIFLYYHEHAGKKLAKDLIGNLLNEPEKLRKDPFIGQIEDLLQERKDIYRYLIFKNYKILYSVDQENRLIKIADVFDTRQNPEKMNRT